MINNLEKETCEGIISPFIECSSLRENTESGISYLMIVLILL
jgi:hypothetical protein